ncbi:hypothetical protein V6Z11_1Z032300 [Gossypium hirsutum]
MGFGDFLNSNIIKIVRTWGESRSSSGVIVVLFVVSNVGSECVNCGFHRFNNQACEINPKTHWKLVKS